MGILSARDNPRQRGSALIFLLVVVACTSIALLMLVSLGGSVASSVVRNEQQIRADYAMQGAVAAIRSSATTGTLTVPSTQTFTIDGFPCVTTVTDNGSNIAGSYQVAIAASQWNRTYALTRIIGLPMGATNSIYRYALALNGASTMTGVLQTLDVAHHADLYSKGGLTLNTSGSSVQGNADLTQPATNKTLTVTGTQTTNYPARTWPTTTDATYQSAANLSLGAFSIGSFSFPSSHYLAYINGDLTLTGGTIQGTGTAYVTGNVTISGDVTYADGSSRLAIICKGTLNPSGHNIVGIYFTNQVDWSSGGTITNGLLCVTSGATFAKNIAVTFDPGIKNGGTEGKSMYLPGLWP